MRTPGRVTTHDRTRRYLLASWITLHVLAGQTLSLAIDSPTAAPDGTAALRLSLGSGTLPPAGLQFTLNYPSQAITSIERFAGSASAGAGKSLTCADGKASLKCLIVGLNSNPIPPGTIAILNVNISSPANGSFKLELADVVAVSAAGDAIPVNATGSTLSVRSDAAPGLLTGNIVNAASTIPGAVAPGELITIFGSGVGPAVGASAVINSSGLVDTTVAGARVLFDGRPAPLIFARSDQINVVAPYEIAGSSTTKIAVEYQGRASASVVLPVADASPALFTLDSSGSGPGAILNQDFSVNSPANPALPGSIVLLYANGAGQMNPSIATGKITLDPAPEPALPISVSIGGADAEVLYAGALVNALAGVVQINVRVPKDVPSGNLPVVLKVGAVSSPGSVTVAVRPAPNPGGAS